MAENDPLGGLPPPAQAQQMFSDPAFLQGMAMIAAKHQRPEAMQWLERAHIAAKEGAFDAVGKLMAGDVQGAVQAWNQTGQFRDVINVNRNLDGTYAINRKDGSTFTLDPVKEYKRMLSPREYLAFQQNEAERKTLSEQRRLDQQHRADTLSEQRRYHDMMIDRYDADRTQRADAARASATIAAHRAVNAGGGGSRGSRSSGGGGGGGGSGSDLDFKDVSKLYENIVKDVRDRSEKAQENVPLGGAAPPPMSDADVSRAAAIRLAQATARFDRDPKSGEHVIRVALPSGQYGVIARYDSEQSAASAIQALQLEGKLPEQGYVRSMGPQPIHNTRDQIGQWRDRGAPRVSHREMEAAAPLPPEVGNSAAKGKEPEKAKGRKLATSS